MLRAPNVVSDPSRSTTSKRPQREDRGTVPSLQSTPAVFRALLRAWRRARAAAEAAAAGAAEGGAAAEHRIRTPALQLQSPFLPFQSVFFTIATTCSRCRIARGLDIEAQVRGIRCLCEHSDRTGSGKTPSAEAQSSSEAASDAHTSKTKRARPRQACPDCRLGQCEHCSCRRLVCCADDSAHESFLYLEFFARREDVLHASGCSDEKPEVF